jgi:hypothetical protein
VATRIPRQLTAKRHALAYEPARAPVPDRRGASARSTTRSASSTPPGAPRAKARRPKRPRRLPKGKLASTCLRLVRQKPGISTPELATCSGGMRTAARVQIRAARLRLSDRDAVAPIRAQRSDHREGQIDRRNLAHAAEFASWIVMRRRGAFNADRSPCPRSRLRFWCTEPCNSLCFSQRFQAVRALAWGWAARLRGLARGTLSFQSGRRV